MEKTLFIASLILMTIAVFGQPSANAVDFGKLEETIQSELKEKK